MENILVAISDPPYIRVAMWKREELPSLATPNLNNVVTPTSVSVAEQTDLVRSADLISQSCRSGNRNGIKGSNFYTATSRNYLMFNLRMLNLME